MSDLDKFVKTLDEIGVKYNRHTEEGYVYISFGKDSDLYLNVFFEFSPDGSLASHP